jgi:hypothetical protein
MSAVVGEVSLTEHAINTRLDEMLKDLKELYIEIIGNTKDEEDQSKRIKAKLIEIGNELINIIKNYKGTNIKNIEEKYIEIRTEIEKNHMPRYERNVYNSRGSNVYYRTNYFNKYLYYPFKWFQNSTIKIELEKLEKNMNKGGKRKSRRNQKSKKSRKTRRRRRR